MSFQLNQSYSRTDFVQFLSNKFLPEDFEPKEAIKINFTFTSKFATSAYCLGTCKSLGLEVFEIHHTSIGDARVGISKDAYQMLLHHSLCNRALVVFVPQEGRQWRLSLIQIEAEINDRTNRLHRSYSNPRRFSFLLGEGAAVKTPTQFLIDKGRIRQRKEGKDTLSPWEDMLSRFSIEALTKDFYTKLYNWFLWARDKRAGVYFPNNIDTDADDRDKLEIKIIRLITRMLFVWFIKQKHLVPEHLFDEKYMKNVLRNFDENSTINGDYYNAILQNLFFATLNQEIEGRRLFNTYHGRSSYYSNKQLYRDTDDSYFTFAKDEREEKILELFKDIPYLNGGLFECLDKYELDADGKVRQVTNYDGFSHENTKNNNHFKKKAFIPNILFFADEHTETVTIQEATGKQTEETEDVKVMGLLPLFKMYNFTVEENTTAEKEVSLDPELLGRVFENLLATYNTETPETVRNSTGSFYTPREIVDYMVDESLIAYLSDTCSHDAAMVRQLVTTTDTPTIDNPEKIIADLKRLKTLDPACGSGAFPMGLLLRMTDIIERLTPQGQFSRFDTKLEIIKNCIYGVDIQAIAMLICKLRFFISLICDCDRDNNKPNYGILPLPNLETKFVAANSLMPAKVKEFADNWTNDEHLKQLQNQLLNLRLGIVDLRTHEAKRNNKIKDHDKCLEIAAYLKQLAGRPNVEVISHMQAVIAECEAELPKYVQERWVDDIDNQEELFDTSKSNIFRYDANAKKRKELNDRIRAAKAAIEKERKKTELKGFAQAVEEVTNWNPYDQNAVSPFFDAEWMFGINNGFDIVIGNPPYVVVKKTDYPSYEWNSDLYKMFFEKGFKDLIKESGILSYITPKFFLVNKDDEDMRKFFMNNMNLISLTLCKPFDVVTENIITYIEKGSTKSIIPIYKHYPSEKSFKRIEDLNIEYSRTNPYSEMVLEIPSAVINLLSKIQATHPIFKDVTISKRGAEVSKNYLRGNDAGLLSLIGMDMKKYSISCDSTYLDHNHKEYKRLKSFFDNDLIYLRRVDSCLEATTSNFHYGFNKNVYGIQVTNDQYNLYYVLAILNTKIVDFYYKKKFSTKKEDVFPEIQTYLYEQLPIPAASKEQQSQFVDIVTTILRKKSEGADTVNEENVIDILAYHLYGLSYDDILIIEPNTCITPEEYSNNILI